MDRPSVIQRAGFMPKVLIFIAPKGLKKNWDHCQSPRTEMTKIANQFCFVVFVVLFCCFVLLRADCSAEALHK